MQQFLYCVRSLETPVTPSVAGFLRDTMGDVIAEDVLRVALLAGFGPGLAPEDTIAIALARWHIKRLTEAADGDVGGPVEGLTEVYTAALERVMDIVEAAQRDSCQTTAEGGDARLGDDDGAEAS
jgi:hypothetical protein